MSGALEREIAEIVAADGPMTVARFMELALGHPAHGYYMTRDPFGAGGDFVTAPEVSQMFGELIGVWCAQAWQTMGTPHPVRLVELGPGRGTLMADLLRAARIMPVFRKAIEVHLVETSPVLRAAQKTALEEAGVAVHWHDSLAGVPDGPAILVANEFFDALPVRQFVFRNGAWHEVVIGIDGDGGLFLGVVPHDLPEDERLDEAPEEGAVLEIAPARRAVAHEIGRRLARWGGAALIVDYGHAARGYGDTLQAVRGHDHVPLLDRPGESDITSHVDFADLAAALARAGTAPYGPVPQGDFLESLGLTARAEALKGGGEPDAAAEIDAAVARLAGRGETEMGSLFKVLVAADRRLPPPYPFTGATS